MKQELDVEWIDLTLILESDRRGDLSLYPSGTRPTGRGYGVESFLVDGFAVSREDHGGR
jgi:hypothetical protein